MRPANERLVRMWCLLSLAERVHGVIPAQLVIPTEPVIFLNQFILYLIILYSYLIQFVYWILMTSCFAWKSGLWFGIFLSIFFIENMYWIHQIAFYGMWYMHSVHRWQVMGCSIQYFEFHLEMFLHFFSSCHRSILVALAESVSQYAWYL